MENLNTEFVSLLISQAATAAKIVSSKIMVSNVIYSHPVVSDVIFYPAVTINEIIPSFVVVPGQAVPSAVVSSTLTSFVSYSYDVTCNAEFCSDLVLNNEISSIKESRV